MIFKNRDKGTWDGIEKAALMGTNFVAHTVVGLVLGYYCDKWFGTAPWGLLFWLILGIVAGFRTMYLDAMKVSKTQTLPKAGGEKAPETAKGASPETPKAAAPDDGHDKGKGGSGNA
ncbi:AtpZ/AtpI family protein [Fundidesulfovibrio terrae]|uniref:AtpZ/AtpI family protein n=1 Tax=Fundidesulfovibrio terrae TaxID=2922866 RepID=UPI001FAFBAE1|nr:AtpZ/AtpI family protein [Fundidesulfovibrio terrae]